MVLEITQRMFKDWLEVNSHGTSHIGALEWEVSNDVQGRLASLFLTFCRGNAVEKSFASRGLRGLLLGEQSLHIDCTTGSADDLASSFDEAGVETFKEPVFLVNETS